MANSIPVILMTPPHGPSPAEQWMAKGRRAASLDLMYILSQVEALGPIYALAAEGVDREAFEAAGAIALEPTRAAFHFGAELVGFAERGNHASLAYFGGASAPLLQKDLLTHAVEALNRVSGPAAVVNNFHSTDWGLMNSAHLLSGLAERLASDNPLGWVLEHDAGFFVHALEPSAATRVDLDTPADLMLLSNHPALGKELSSFLAQAPGAHRKRLEEMRSVLSSPGRTMIVIGRSSSDAWRQLERRTQIWVRLFVEERGMAASGRLERGEVRSLVAQLLEDTGAEAFVEGLSSLSDAVLWDTRVWMAHRGEFPSAADRFAADLGWVDQIEDSALRRLTHAVNDATIPIVTGGHGVVSGGVYALVEGLPSN
jgi:hypothetical protein